MGKGQVRQTRGCPTSQKPKSVCPFKHPHPRCHRSDSCRESSFPSVPSPEFPTARRGGLRRPLAPAALGGRVLRGRPLPPGVGAGWRRACVSGSPAGDWGARASFGLGLIIKWLCPLPVSGPRGKRSEPRSPATPRTATVRSGSAPRLAQLPDAAASHLPSFLSLAEWRLGPAPPGACSVRTVAA